MLEIEGKFCAMEKVTFTDMHENRSQMKPVATTTFVSAIYVTEKEKKKTTKKPTTKPKRAKVNPEVKGE